MRINQINMEQLKVLQSVHFNCKSISQKIYLHESVKGKSLENHITSNTYNWHKEPVVISTPLFYHQVYVPLSIPCTITHALITMINFMCSNIFMGINLKFSPYIL